MMQRILQNRLLLVTALVFAVCLAPLSVAAQTSKEVACETVQNLRSDVSCGDRSDSGSSLNSLVEAALQIISVVAGVIAVIMIIVSGLKYVTSSGDANNIKSAKNTLIYAIVGLVIVVLAQIIVRFVLSEAS